MSRRGQWLASLERHLQVFTDPSEAKQAVRLRGVLESLKEQS
jgi:hypothetical protein